MKKYNFDEIIERVGTDSIKWEYTHKFVKGAPEDALPLWVADMDFQCSEPILDALYKRVDQKIFGYSYHGSDEYYNAVLGWFKRRFDWTVDKENVFYSPGVVPAIGFLINILTEEGDGVIIQRPVYYPFTEKIEKNNRRVVNNRLKYDDGQYSIDFDDLEKKLMDKTNKVLILCSPHNPIGRVWRADELEHIAMLCKKYDKWIISDEIHCDIVRKGIKHTPLEKICPEYKDRIITCTAPSKTFNLAGMQLSNIIINDKDVQTRWNNITGDRFGLQIPNPFAIVATIAAYNDSEDWLDELLDYIDSNFNYVYDFINTHMPKAKIVKSEGTYLAWIDFSPYNIDYKHMEELMFNKGKVVLDEGYIFGDEGKGFERINVACPRSILERCMVAVKNGLKEYLE